MIVSDGSIAVELGTGTTSIFLVGQDPDGGASACKRMAGREVLIIAVHGEGLKTHWEKERLLYLVQTAKGTTTQPVKPVCRGH